MGHYVRAIIVVVLFVSNIHASQLPWKLLFVDADHCPDVTSAGIQFDDKTVYVNYWDSGHNAYFSTTSGKSWVVCRFDNKNPSDALGARIAYMNQGTGIVLNDEGDYLFKDTGGKWEKWKGKIQSVCIRGRYGYITEKKSSGNPSSCLHSTDTGGIDWIKIASDDVWFDGISSFDRLNNSLVYALVYVFDGKGKLITHLARTVDNGAHWADIVNIESLIDLWPTHIFFLDSKIGWVSSDRDEGLFFTTDGGVSWKETKAPDRIISGIYFRDRKSGRVLGGPTGQIYETHDGGDTWRSMSRDEVEREDFVSYFGSAGVDRWNELAVYGSLMRCSIK